MQDINQNTHKKKFLKLVGYILLILSCIFWGAALVFPFVLEKKQSLALTPGFIIIGEVTFYLSILLLGKEIWNKMKSYFKFKARRIDKN